MDFTQYLQQYEERKRLRGGIEPGQAEAEKIFTPYFNEASQRELAGRKINLQEKALTNQENQFNEGLAWNKEKTLADLAQTREQTLANLALDRYKNDLMQQAANTGDRNQMIGNALSTAGSLGSMYLLKQGGYFNPYRRY